MYLIYLIYRYLLHVGPSMGNLYVNFSFACAMSISLLLQDLRKWKRLPVPVVKRGRAAGRYWYRRHRVVIVGREGEEVRHVC